MDLTLNFGGAWSDTERGAVTREFRLLSLGNLPFYERYQRPDYLLSDYNISQGYLTLRETTGGTGAAAYDASLETRAAYVEVESQLTRSEDHTSELQSLMRISYAVFCLK